jgi:LuxR family maltose regulon positive regulatory protein
MRTAAGEAGSSPPITADRGLVPRPRLTARIQAKPSARLVVLTAPPGYSKTTCLREWSEQDGRPFAWVTASARLDDPAALLFSIVDALDEIDPVDPEVLAPLASPRPNIAKTVLPRLSRSIHSRRRPFVLVIDDAHALSCANAIAVVAAVIDSLPEGSQLAIATRTEPAALSLGRLRANRQLVELAARDLAMTREESLALLGNLGVTLNEPQLDLIFERTEGWPAALYLAGLALADQSDLGKAVRSFAGDDRIVVDYLRDEFLSAIDPERLDFLTRTSILDELTGPLCDAVLGASGSAETLEELARSNALVIPLDRNGDRFRYHHLFGEMLHAELHRHMPLVEPELHDRASRWCADHGDVDRAIEHAIAAEDAVRAGDLIWQAFPELIGRGRLASIERWLDRLGDEADAGVPSLALTRAHVNLNLGEGAGGAHWSRLASKAAESSPGGKAAIEGDLLLIKAILGADGVVQTGKDAARASELHGPESPWQAPCYWFRGVSSHLAGHPERAKPLLQEAVRRGAVGTPFVEVMALAQLALLAKDDENLDAALRLIMQAHEQVVRCGLTEYPSISLVPATAALIAASCGRSERAEADTKHAERLLDRLVDVPGWYEAQTRIVLAGAAIRLDDLRRARALLDSAEVFLELTPDAAILTAWLEETRGALDSATFEAGDRGWSLTTAELRTLQYLPSHLTFREIGERVHVSANTVKTQARAVYRKLDASSRAEAVETAREGGLLRGDPLGGDG